MLFVAVLRLDREVHEFTVFAEEAAIIIRRSRLVGDDRNDRGKFSGAYLPDVEIGHRCIAVAFTARRISSGKSEEAGVRSSKMPLVSRKRL